MRSGMPMHIISEVAFPHQPGCKTPSSEAASLIWELHTGSEMGRLPNTCQERRTMKLKNVIVISALVAAVALGACRREVAHEPMKLGADVAVEQAAR
jgi:hypothetical protein